MKLGRYNSIPTDFKSFEMRRIQLNFHQKLFVESGCGPNALSALTGKSPLSFYSKHVSNHYSDKKMLEFLHNNDLKTVELTIGSLTNNSNPLFQPSEEKINRRHCLLI